MVEPQQQVNFQMPENSLFADSVATALRLKAAKGEKGEVSKEGLVEIVFVDSVRQKAVTSVIVTRLTVKDLIAALSQTLSNFDKEMSSKAMPKIPEAKGTNLHPHDIR